jgi:hypothetical protein
MDVPAETRLCHLSTAMMNRIKKIQKRLTKLRVEQSSVFDVLFVLVVIGRRELSFHCQVAVLLPQISFLQIVSVPM